jgi:hypothetical protein
VELKDLTADERVALVALLEMVIDSARVLTEGDVDQVSTIVAQVGERPYQEAVAEVERRFRDEDAVKRFLATIRRQDARDRIYEAVLEAAMPDSINEREAALLDWLASEWQTAVRFEPEAGGS